MKELSIDFETRSTVDLKRCGVHVYAEHPSTDIWMMAWAMEGDEPQLWIPGEPLPLEVTNHIRDHGHIRGWNVGFERTIWRAIMTLKYGAPAVKNNQWMDTAAEASAMALPRALNHAAQVLGLTMQKDSDGHDLMMRMARPRKVVDGKPIWWDDPTRFARLGEYCKQDVRTEQAVSKVVRRLVAHEQEVFLLDTEMNDRGIRVDIPLVMAAKEIAEEGIKRADDALVELTGGGITSIKNNRQLLAWVKQQGIAVDSIGKPTVQGLLDGSLDPVVREVLQVRVDAGRSSVAKLESMLDVAGTGDRLRGLLLYHGAGTGRWAGKLVQPQNFPRGDVKDIERFIPLVMEGRYDEIDLYSPPLAVISSMLRSMLIPSEGMEFAVGDYSAIEARVLNWLAGQEDVLETFRLYDAGDKSKDPYRIMAARMGSTDRQAGKAAELGCGFQMGAKKFVDAAWKVYQVVVDKEQAKLAVKAYRSSHEKVRDFWYETERSCIKAISEPGAPVVFGGQRNLRVVVAGAYLYIVLPSGRPLAYAAPRAVERMITIENEDGEEVQFTKVCMEFSGVDSMTRQWGRMRAYGGLLVENIVQAVARDFMVFGMEQVTKDGYIPLLTVHDEVIAERLVGQRTALVFQKLLASTPEWGRGCPIAAEAWIGSRYRKG